MIVLRRIGDGILGHFHIRLTEWTMVLPAVLMGVALTQQQDMFDISRSYAMLASWAEEIIWGIIVMFCGMVRLIALIVNGTFRSFKKSPHLRFFASFVCSAFWFQFAYGFTIAAIYHGGAWSGPAAYWTLATFEFINLYRSWTDIEKGRVEQNRK